MTASASLTLAPLGTVLITIARQTRLDGLPAGGRLIGEAATCVFEGAGEAGALHASQAGACSDWLTLHGDGSVAVDARLLLATESGSRLTIRYQGRATAMPATGAPVYVTPLFETDDPDWSWLNTVQAVGKGVRDHSSLRYELYQLV